MPLAIASNRGVRSGASAPAAAPRRARRWLLHATVLLACSLEALLPGASARAATEDSLEALHTLMNDKDTSPIPLGWTIGGATYAGTPVYQADSPSVLAFPGAIYLSPHVLYLGDRLSATIVQQGPLRFYGRGRLRFDSLSPGDHPEWSGLNARRWEVEGGLGVQALTPAGLVSLRVGSDLMGRSRGQDAVASMDFPVVRANWVVMPSVALIWRSSNLANYYYGGVSRAEAAPAHPYYDVGAVASFAVSVVASYRYDRHWIGALVGGYERYAGAVRDSPLIGRAGSLDTLAGIGYVF